MEKEPTSKKKTSLEFTESVCRLSSSSQCGKKQAGQATGFYLLKSEGQSLFLFCKEVHLYHFFFFLDSAYKWYHMIAVSLSDLFSTTISTSIHVTAKGIISFLSLLFYFYFFAS